MRLHHLEFFGGKGSRLLEDMVFDADFADVVKLGGDLQDLHEGSRQCHFFGNEQRIARNAIGVTASVGVLFVDRSGQHLDRAHEQRPVFFGGALQVFNKVFEFLRHGVEGLGQFADFGSAQQMNTLREVAAGDRTA